MTPSPRRGSDSRLDGPATSPAGLRAVAGGAGPLPGAGSAQVPAGTATRSRFPGNTTGDLPAVDAAHGARSSSERRGSGGDGRDRRAPRNDLDARRSAPQPRAEAVSAERAA